eukprot:gnl/TRDRNA2_/TRDRNA2_80580_c1_seq1.p1 gnl/TRDRNA2_/TRDRNA2_80580_c1~~gnl/TRDRNA2_/TRDRNA2_80580_c1_seq1.p1  ORF type:complete len:117 (+),score=15.15 gnl/TRDRNA2_/TRDRNA2_80580_c1_seq1:115-465(+)
MADGTPKKSLLSAFFFFKSLGFAKPEDSVVRLLSACVSERFLIQIVMGPKGLTRLSVILVEPSNPISKELAASLKFDYKSDGIEKVKAIMGTDPDVIDYAANAKGYAVGIGFTAAT